MSSFTLNFNQFVDLAVDPVLGSVNTPLLHNLLHIIINQMHLSSNFIEFHGIGSREIENLIVNSQRQCEVEINELLMKEEVDETTGNIVKRQEKAHRPVSGETIKLFSIRKVEAEEPKSPKGHSLNSIQMQSIDEFKRLQTKSTLDVLEKDSNDEFQSPDISLQTTFNLINISKRLDALETGIRQLADVLKKVQCDVKEERDESDSLIDGEIKALHQKIDNLSHEMKQFNCRCNDEDFRQSLMTDFQTKITQDFEDFMKTMRSEMENLQSLCKTSLENIKHERIEFKDSVCEQLKSYRNDFLACMTELQAMMDTKLDKVFVPDLKEYLQDKIRYLEEKIENVDCQKALAAGVAKRVVKDLNCVSCGDDVIQADARNPAKLLLKNNGENPIQPQLLLRLPTRLCGGNHTITKPNERIFRSENCQN